MTTRRQEKLRDPFEGKLLPFRGGPYDATVMPWKPAHGKVKTFRRGQRIERGNYIVDPYALVAYWLEAVE